VKELRRFERFGVIRSIQLYEGESVKIWIPFGKGARAEVEADLLLLCSFLNQTQEANYPLEKD